MTTDLSQKIKQSYQGFSKGHKKIANVILNDYDKVAYMTASSLGKLVVSRASIHISAAENDALSVVAKLNSGIEVGVVVK